MTLADAVVPRHALVDVAVVGAAAGRGCSCRRARGCGKKSSRLAHEVIGERVVPVRDRAARRDGSCRRPAGAATARQTGWPALPTAGRRSCAAPASRRIAPRCAARRSDAAFSRSSSGTGSPRGSTTAATPGRGRPPRRSGPRGRWPAAVRAGTRSADWRAGLRAPRWIPDFEVGVLDAPALVERPCSVLHVVGRQAGSR